MKKNETKEKQEKKFSKEGLSPKRTEIDLKEFVKHIKPFEWYGSQRDLSPELKRIVKNLACQEHKYVYCPSCRTYDQVDYDPIENMNKFIAFIKEE